MSALRDGLEDWDGLFWDLDPEKGAALLKQLVRGPRDWNFAGQSTVDEIRLAAATAAMRRDQN